MPARFIVVTHPSIPSVRYPVYPIFRPDQVPASEGYPSKHKKHKVYKKRSKYLLVTHEQHRQRKHQSLFPTSFRPSQLPRHLRRLVIERGRLAISAGSRSGRTVLQSVLIRAVRVTATLEVATTIAVHTRVDIVVPEGLQQLVEPASQESTESGTQPVDPVVSGEVAVDNGRAEGAGRIETAAGKVDACLHPVSI